MIIPVGKSFMILPDSHNGEMTMENREAIIGFLACIILGTLLIIGGYIYEIIKEKELPKNIYILDNFFIFFGILWNSASLFIAVLAGIMFLLYKII